MIRLRYYCPFAVPSGYAQAAHEYLCALLEAGAGKLELQIAALHDCDTDSLEPEYAHLAQYAVSAGDMLDMTWPTHVVSHTIPRYAHLAADLAEYASPVAVLGSKASRDFSVRTVCVTTWETQHFPAEDADLLEAHFDKVVVPSAWNADVIADKMRAPVNVIPHCYDPSWWRISDAPPPPGPYTFLWIGAWSERKNPIGVLKAYFAAFRKSDNVLLRMVVPKGSSPIALQDIEALARSMDLPDFANVQMLTARMSMSDIRALHYASHCYVTATRGEAWGLGSFEAAVVGNQVIAPEGTGHDHYLADYDAFQGYEAQMTPAVTGDKQIGSSIDIGGMKFAAVGQIAPTGIAGNQMWLEPNLASLILHMRESYDNRRWWERTPGRFENLFSRKIVGEQFMQLLEGL